MIKRLLSCALLLAPIAGAAQVGYDPAHSPYRDLIRGMGPLFSTGYLSGERGRVPVGHSNGRTFTLGYEASMTGPTSFTAMITYARTDRFVVDPSKDDSVRKSGPFADDMVFVELGLRFNLTGPKSWRSFVPYLSGSAGVALSEGSPVDSSGYKFGKKFTLSPGVGLRWYPARRVAVTFDSRAVFWRLRYPPDFKRISSPDGIPVLAGDQPETDWTVHPMVSFGIGWTF